MNSYKLCTVDQFTIDCKFMCVYVHAWTYRLYIHTYTHLQMVILHTVFFSHWIRQFPYNTAGLFGKNNQNIENNTSKFIVLKL